MRLPGSFCRNVSLSYNCSTDERDSPRSFLRDTFDFSYLEKYQIPSHPDMFSYSTSTSHTKATDWVSRACNAHLQRLQLELLLGEERRKKQTRVPVIAQALSRSGWQLILGQILEMHGGIVFPPCPIASPPHPQYTLKWGSFKDKRWCLETKTSFLFLRGEGDGKAIQRCLRNR